MRRLGMLTTVATAVLLQGLVQGCTGTACTEMGASSVLIMRMPADLAEGTQTMDVRLCQDDGCASARIPVQRFDPGESLTWDVPLLLDEVGDGDWQASEAVATVSGSDRRGDLVFESRKAVTLREQQPNGAGCDPTVLEDRIRVP